MHEAQAGSRKNEMEKAIIEDKLDAAMGQLAVPEESGWNGRDANEPFTPELREQMVRLQSRESLLQEKLNSEVSEQVAQLVVEVNNLGSMKEHFEQRFHETSRNLNITQEHLASTNLHVETLQEKLASLGEQFQAVERFSEEKAC